MFLGTSKGNAPWDVRTTASSISDGASTTILLTENILRRRRPGRRGRADGDRPHQLGVPAPQLRRVPGLGQRLQRRRDGPGGDRLLRNLLARAQGGKTFGPHWANANRPGTHENINAGLELTEEGGLAVSEQPSSRRRQRRDVRRLGPVHRRGHRREVWAKLVTPQGSKLPEPFGQSPLDPSDLDAVMWTVDRVGVASWRLAIVPTPRDPGSASPRRVGRTALSRAMPLAVASNAGCSAIRCQSQPDETEPLLFPTPRGSIVAKSRLAAHSRLWMAVALCGLLSGLARADDRWITLPGSEGPGKGKHVVLISGDEEYRSEEALPQLAKILAKRHGFTCTVLFAIGQDGTIDPDRRDNIPGLEALEKADLMVLFTRFRDLPDDQMKRVVDYVESGRPIIGMRTATHAFDVKAGKTFARYGWNNKEWDGGFGRNVLGETWISHHGSHGKQSTRGVIAEGAEGHPILRGHQGRGHLGADRRLRRPAAAARRQQAAGPGAGPRGDEADGPARRGEGERPDDADRLGEDLHRGEGQGRPASSRPRWGPRRTWRAKACAGCWSTPATGPWGWRTRSPPRPTWRSWASTIPARSASGRSPRASGPPTSRPIASEDVVASGNVPGSHVTSREGIAMSQQESGRTSRRRMLEATSGAVLGLAALNRAGEAAETPVATKGRIKQSIVHWCFADHWDVPQMIKVAKGLGCGSIELIEPKYFPLLKEDGLECAIGTIDMAPDPPFAQGVQQPQAPRSGASRPRATPSTPARSSGSRT